MEYYDEVVEINQRKQETVKESVLGENNQSFQTLDDEQIKTIPRPRPQSSRKQSLQKSESFGSDSETSESEPNNVENKHALAAEHKDWEKLNVSSEIKEIFQYILRYSPQKIEIDYVLQPFIPSFIPAVGDIDAFLKVIPPKPLDEKSNVLQLINKLGLEILDEPCGEQSEPALLHMKLRSVSTQPRTPGGPPPSVSKSQKDIDKWITEIRQLHVNQPFPMVVHRKPAQDIDALMMEWPPEMEKLLNNLGFPSASLNCPLTFYIEVICSMFDISIPTTKSQSDYIYALFTLFNLFMAIKNPIQ